VVFNPYPKWHHHIVGVSHYCGCNDKE